MVSPPMSSQGPGLRFRVAGIPVRIDMSFFIVGVLFSIGDNVDFVLVAVVLLVFGVSILVHEMGHALVARTTGAQPAIVLHGFGGLTSWSPTREVTRMRRIAIALAGPVSGMALGVVCLALQQTSLADEGRTTAHVLRLAVLINIFYGLFNLLPILPLDGGQVMRDLLPGAEETRDKIAASVSVVVGAATAIVPYRAGYLFAAMFVALFTATNLMALTGARPRRTPRRAGMLSHAQTAYDNGWYGDAATEALKVAEEAVDEHTQSAAIQLAAWARLAEGRAADANALLLDLPAGSVDPVLEGKVLMATGHVFEGLSTLRSAYERTHSELAAYELAVALATAGRADELVAAVADPRAPAAAVLAGSYGAHATGAYAPALRLAEHARSVAANDGERAAATYALARSAARAGDLRHALDSLRSAITMLPGYADVARRDAELEALRYLPEFSYLVGGAAQS